MSPGMGGNTALGGTSATGGLSAGHSIGMNSTGLGNTPAGQKHSYGKVQDHRPAARDGHSGIIYQGRFIVFGGDRHHMPFNDLHFLHIEKEFKERALKI